MNPSDSQQPNQQPAAPAAPTSLPQPAPLASAPIAPGPLAPAPLNAPVQPLLPPDPSSQDGQPTLKPKTNPVSTQNMLQVAEIRDGIVIMNDGSFRSVVMLKSINFDLMSPREREGVESGYQAFLNSLYFPVQIFVRSQKVDIRPYLEKLDKIRSEHDNMLLALLMEDYIGYITEISTQTNIMDKNFYIILPFFAKVDVQKAITQSKNFFSGLTGIFNKSSQQHVTVTEKDLEDAKVELRNRVQAVLGGLQQCSVPGVPLDTQELIELYYDFYNPDTATRQQLKNFDDLSTQVVTKAQGQAPQPNLDKELV
jgi:hypothetical protein